MNKAAKRGRKTARVPSPISSRPPVAESASLRASTPSEPLPASTPSPTPEMVQASSPKTSPSHKPPPEPSPTAAPSPALASSPAPDLDGLLHQHGLRNTPQRQLIYRIVSSSAQHVNAVQVQHQLETLMPGISLPTVYATLELFADLGIIHKMAMVDGAMLYDTGQQRPHAHMVCRECGRIFDLDVPPVNTDEVNAAAQEGFSVDSGDLVLHGLCKDCRRRNETDSH